jgi:RNA-directed DNA polymerase
MQSIKAKTFKNKLTFDLFLNAFYRAKKCKGQKYEILKFESNLEVNIWNLVTEIKTNTYQIGNYHEFTIYEPKERIIKSLPFRDRIVHQWYVEEFIKPYFVPRFINDTYACIVNKGTHKASYKLRKMINSQNNNNYYFIKCDIKKYFYNIDKRILIDIFKKTCKDQDLINFTYLLLYSKDNNNIGLPIGNYTSQYFANIYLNELDKYLKYKLKIKYYLRYMDDFICIVNNKQDAKKLLFNINNFLVSCLNLNLNHKSRIIPGFLSIDFVGYKITGDKVSVRKSCLIKMNNKLNNHYVNNLDPSFNSFKAHLKHSNSINIINNFSIKVLDLKGQKRCTTGIPF